MLLYPVEFDLCTPLTIGHNLETNIVDIDKSVLWELPGAQNTMGTHDKEAAVVGACV
jgi:hypothetical protein